MEFSAGSVAGVKDEGIDVWGEATRRALSSAVDWSL